MATTGVMRPGHIQLRVLDLDESVEFYKNVLGLVETGRDAAGRVAGAENRRRLRTGRETLGGPVDDRPQSGRHSARLSRLRADRLSRVGPGTPSSAIPRPLRSGA